MESAAEIVQPTFEPGRRECKECGNQFDLPPFEIAARYVSICPDCSEKHAQEDQAVVLRKAALFSTEAWKSICPPLYWETDPSKLPNKTKYDRAMKWDYGPRGLVLHGPTRSGKSRTAWSLMKRLMVSELTVTAMNCEFGYEYGAKFEQGAKDAYAWMQHRFDVDVLLLDDVFKVKLTDSVEQCLFAIVNHRLEYGKPIIATTQDVGDTLATRMSDDRGQAFVRRLRECCDMIAFV